MIKKLLTPDYLVEKIEDIRLDFFKEKKIKGLIIDLDNTITFYNSRRIGLQVEEWIKMVLQEDISIVLLSNNKERRIKETIKDFPIDYVEKARKPFKRGYIKALKKLNLSAENVIMIGDQIFTDTLGAKRAGLEIILVNPLPGKEYWFTYISRFFERRVKEALIKESQVLK